MSHTRMVPSKPEVAMYLPPLKKRTQFTPLLLWPPEDSSPTAHTANVAGSWKRTTPS